MLTKIKDSLCVLFCPGLMVCYVFFLLFMGRWGVR